MDSRQREETSPGPEMEMHGGVCNWEMQVILATVQVREGSHVWRKVESPPDNAECAKQRSTYILGSKWAAAKSM